MQGMTAKIKFNFSLELIGVSILTNAGQWSAKSIIIIILSNLLRDITVTNTRILEHGPQMFNTRITPQQCEREKYTHLFVCFKCYKYEDYTTKQCTCPQHLSLWVRGNRTHIWTLYQHIQKMHQLQQYPETHSAGRHPRTQAVTKKETQEQ